MCFMNLPIEFDAHGRARLRDATWGEPFAPRARDNTLEQLARSAHLRDFDIDPVTRVAGALSFHTVIDLERRQVVEARTEASLFRGYELILQGRESTDAIHISSRACGVCGGVHATCAAMALEMASGVVPPPLAIIARNLGEGAELVYDHTLHLFLLAGPDYSEIMVRRTTPALWERAQQSEAPRAAAYGLRTVAEIMRGLNPLSGPLYVEALQITRHAREIASLMLGKYPHPSTIFPGGLGIEASPAVFNQVLGRIMPLLDYAKKVAAIWDDLVEFFVTEVPEYQRVGERRINLLCTGMWDDPEAYDASYARCSAWGEQRLATPGAIESMSEALFLLDVAGRIIRVNRAAGTLLECDIATLSNQPFAAACAAPDIPATPWQLLAQAPSGSLPNVDTEFRTLAGHVIPVSLSCSLVRDQRGKATGVLVIARNITRRKQAEAERQELHKQLVEASRRAGMADVAASVLHNVGNVLNSLNVSLDLVTSTLRNSLAGDVGRIATMLQEHTAALGEYLTHDPKGMQIPAYLPKLATRLTQERTTALQELDTLSNKVAHIRHVIARQQGLAKASGVHEVVVLTDLMEEALAIELALLQRHHIVVLREYADIPAVLADKHQVLQILVNLLSNAKYAMLARDGQQRLLLRIGLAEDRQSFVRLQVCDTGVGIKPEYLTRIFAQGFTTKKDGHGLGLHSSALAAKAMGGSLSAHSEGEGEGAIFTLDLPLKSAKERL